MFKFRIPAVHEIKSHRQLRWMQHHLSAAYLWEFNSDTVARGVFVGLFAALIPAPIQMLLAAIFSVVFRANLIVAVVGTWVSNPFTMIPFAYSAYRVGHFVLRSGGDLTFLHFKWSMIPQVMWPFLLGSLVLGLALGSIGFVLVKLTWKWFAR